MSHSVVTSGNLAYSYVPWQPDPVMRIVRDEVMPASSEAGSGSMKWIIYAGLLIIGIGIGYCLHQRWSDVPTEDQP